MRAARSVWQPAGTQMSNRKSNDPWADREHPVKENMAFQKKNWAAQRIGWMVLLLVVVLALLGLFSDGPLSHARAVSADGSLQVEYQRFLKHGAESDLRIIAAPASPQREISITMDRALADSMSVEYLMPQPEASSGGEQGLQLTYAAPEREPAILSLKIRPGSFGRVRGRVSFADQSVVLNQFIYP